MGRRPRWADIVDEDDDHTIAHHASRDLVPKNVGADFASGATGSFPDCEARRLELSAPTDAAPCAPPQRILSEVSIKVGNLPSGMTEDSLVLLLMTQHGIATTTDCYIPERGSRKYAFLRFASMDEAQKVLEIPVDIGMQGLTFELARGHKKDPSAMREDGIQTGRQQPEAGRGWQPDSSSPHDRHQPIVERCPQNPHVSAAAPSVKVSPVRRSMTTADLYQAFVYAGCKGFITDVFIPRDRKYGFVRFNTLQEARQATALTVQMGGEVVSVEIAVGNRSVMEGASSEMCRSFG